MFKLTVFCYLQQMSPQQAQFTPSYWVFNFSAACRTWGCLQSTWKISIHLREIKLLFIKTLTWAMDMSTASLCSNRQKSEVGLVFIKSSTAMELNVSVYGHPWLSHVGMATCKSCIYVHSGTQGWAVTKDGVEIWPLAVSNPTLLSPVPCQSIF